MISRYQDKDDKIIVKKIQGKHFLVWSATVNADCRRQNIYNKIALLA